MASACEILIWKARFWPNCEFRDRAGFAPLEVCFSPEATRAEVEA